MPRATRIDASRTVPFPDRERARRAQWPDGAGAFAGGDYWPAIASGGQVAMPLAGVLFGAFADTRRLGQGRAYLRRLGLEVPKRTSGAREGEPRRGSARKGK